MVPGQYKLKREPVGDLDELVRVQNYDKLSGSCEEAPGNVIKRATLREPYITLMI